MLCFCTRCGTQNEAGNAFCESCGAPLRQAEKSAHVTVRAPSPALKPVRGRGVLLGVVIAWFVVLGGGAAYWAAMPPSPTQANLLAAAQAAYGDRLLAQTKRELCLSNMDYGVDEFNVAAYDSRTQAWLNILVSAGLYSPGISTNSGGMFPQPMVQYLATPLLAQWRDGASLCVAKRMVLADVVEIDKPTEVTLDGRSMPVVSARIEQKSEQTAPWLSGADVKGKLLPLLNKWRYEGGALHKVEGLQFLLLDGRWTTGPAVLATLNSPSAAMAHHHEAHLEAQPGLLQRLANLFHFGGNPLKGRWRLASTEIPGWGVKVKILPGMIDGDEWTFTDDTIEVDGKKVKCQYIVEDHRVTVINHEEQRRLVFVMKDNDTAVVSRDGGELIFRRVR
jgi:predicted thioesterase